MCHKNARRERAPRLCTCSNSLRVLRLATLSLRAFQNPTFTNDWRKTIPKSRRAKKNWSRTHCKSAKKSISLSETSKNIRSNTSTSLEKSRTRFMPSGSKKIISRWRSHSGSLSLCRRHRCTRSWRRKSRRRRGKRRRYGIWGRCKRCRGRRMGKSFGKISNLRFQKYSAGSCYSGNLSHGKRKKSYVR